MDGWIKREFAVKQLKHVLRTLGAKNIIIPSVPEIRVNALVGDSIVFTATSIDEVIVMTDAHELINCDLSGLFCCEGAVTCTSRHNPLWALATRLCSHTFRALGVQSIHGARSRQTEPRCVRVLVYVIPFLVRKVCSRSRHPILASNCVSKALEVFTSERTRALGDVKLIHHSKVHSKLVERLSCPCPHFVAGYPGLCIAEEGTGPLLGMPNDLIVQVEHGSAC
mmetsp:Transcript_11308/g.20067  ORF Transcript_11308/g.20067 Transcript_11308/m.20067 type:complete len:224 (-) Transcript_11308:839-1510(-)